MVKSTGDRVYSDTEIADRLARDLPRWVLADGMIRRSFRTGGWRATLMIVNTVGHLAEAAWHHPEILMSYATVEVRLETHDAGGITDKDFALAKKIEDVVLWRPGIADGGLEGVPIYDPRHAYVTRD